MDKFFKVWDMYGEQELLLNIDRIVKMEIQEAQGGEHAYELVGFVESTPYVLKKFSDKQLADEFMSRRPTV